MEPDNSIDPISEELPDATDVPLSIEELAAFCGTDSTAVRVALLQDELKVLTDRIDTLEHSLSDNWEWSRETATVLSKHIAQAILIALGLLFVFLPEHLRNYINPDTLIERITQFIAIISAAAAGYLAVKKTIRNPDS